MAILLGLVIQVDLFVSTITEILLLRLPICWSTTTSVWVPRRKFSMTWNIHKFVLEKIFRCSYLSLCAGKFSLSFNNARSVERGSLGTATFCIARSPHPMWAIMSILWNKLHVLLIITLIIQPKIFILNNSSPISVLFHGSSHIKQLSVLSFLHLVFLLLIISSGYAFKGRISLCYWRSILQQQRQISGHW